MSAMERMKSSVSTSELTTAYWDIQRANKERLERLRAVSTPTAGVTSYFNPDDAGFLTAPLRGFTSMQVGSGAGVYGTIAANADYGVTPQGSTQPLQPTPGQPNLIYPVAAGSASFRTNFIRGGKSTPTREYDNVPLQPDFLLKLPGSNVAPLDTDFFTRFHAMTNSPLPPGYRYKELNDYRADNTAGDLLALGKIVSRRYYAESLTSIPLDQLDASVMVHDYEGRYFPNIIPYAVNTDPDSQFGESYITFGSNPAYFSGTVRDPLSWVEHDKYWQSFGITKETIQAFFDAFPTAKLY